MDLIFICRLWSLVLLLRHVDIIPGCMGLILEDFEEYSQQFRNKCNKLLVLKKLFDTALLFCASLIFGSVDTFREPFWLLLFNLLLVLWTYFQMVLVVRNIDISSIFIWAHYSVLYIWAMQSAELRSLHDLEFAVSFLSHNIVFAYLSLDCLLFCWLLRIVRLRIRLRRVGLLYRGNGLHKLFYYNDNYNTKIMIIK